MSEEGRAKISKSAKERYKNNSKIVKCNNCKLLYKIALSRYLNGKGKYCSKNCMTLGTKGKHYSPNTEFKKGQKAWNKGKNCTEIIGKGQEVGYKGLHQRIEKIRGKPKHCELCNTRKAKIYDWANISGNYLPDIQDWFRLCRSCHKLYDNQNYSNRWKIFKDGYNK